jgi:hypothetical protein
MSCIDIALAAVLPCELITRSAAVSLCPAHGLCFQHELSLSPISFVYSGDMPVSARKRSGSEDIFEGVNSLPKSMGNCIVWPGAHR